MSNTILPKPGSEFISEDSILEYLVKPYKRGEAVSVVFKKRDGTLRLMKAQRDHGLESRVLGLFDTSTSGCITVCETTDDGAHQWRKINLAKILKIEC